MKNPRLFFRVDGKVPTQHIMLGYSIPFTYILISKLIKEFTEGIEWKTIQIKIMPSLIADKTKVLIISTELKNLNVPPDHLVMLLDERTRQVITSCSTVEELFDLVDENAELKTSV